MTASAFDDLVSEPTIVVCCGSGGVGKTTTAATVALHAARLGRRAVVVTIDPARRLADALGLDGGLTNEPSRVELPAGQGVAGELWAMMLDTRATFDALVTANARDPQQAERILANPFYRNISGALSGTQEYMAGEKLHALHSDERFDLVVVDTPPTRNALDFLDAPGTLARFLDHPLFRLLMAPARSGLRVLNFAAQPVLRTIGKVVGGAVLNDAIAFFQAFQGMEQGFRRRAEEVMALLRDDTTRYVLVASPRRDPIDEARYFAARLGEHDLQVAALVLNRTTPRFGSGTAAQASARAAAGGPDASWWSNLAELRQLAESEAELAAPLVAEVGDAPVAWVPTLGSDVHDLAGLHRIEDVLAGLGR